jgi:hypothetical protein
MDSRQTQIIERLGRIEDQLHLLSAHAGIPFGTDGDGEVPHDVVTLARGDERVKAALRLTEMTGMDFSEAQRLVNRL